MNHTMGQQESIGATWLDLYDYRARMARMYAERDAAVRAGEDPAVVWARWRDAKDALYAGHLQTPLSPDDRRAFTGLNYFAYNPTFAVEATLVPETAEAGEVPASGPLSARFPVAGRLRFHLGDSDYALAVYWIDVYGGGLFCPVRDATSGKETYGGGRYLFDTVKGSDFVRLGSRLGSGEGTPGPVVAGGYAGGPVLIDFNYLYNPSCAYDPRWACPLAPAENVLPVRLAVGERAYAHHNGEDGHP